MKTAFVLLCALASASALELSLIPDFGTIEGPFQVTGIEYGGTHDGEATYEMSLASAGQLAFTAQPVA